MEVITGGLNYLPYLISISVSMAVIIKDHMKALGLDQVYTYVVRITYKLLYIVNMSCTSFIVITSWTRVHRNLVVLPAG